MVLYSMYLKSIEIEIFGSLKAYFKCVDSEMLQVCNPYNC
jgi:hypothetical protein